MRVTARLAALAAVAAFLGAATLAAEEKKADKTTADKKAPDFANLTDAQFAEKASGAGLAEVNLARLAVERASRPEIKEFAQRMLADHTKANAQLIQVANTK